MEEQNSRKYLDSIMYIIIYDINDIERLKLRENMTNVNRPGI